MKREPLPQGSMAGHRKGFFQALDVFSLGALAKGYTMPREDGGHYICITNAYSFVNDSFNFDGWQWLGNWDFENYDFTPANPFTTRLTNGKFTDFANRVKYGRDFRIVSPLYEIPKKELDFKGKEEIGGAICWRAAQ